MNPHKHAKIIKAWADGAEIQCRSPDGHWRYQTHPNWDEENEYRIKPEITLVKYFACEIATKTIYRESRQYADLKITWDCVTGKIKKAEVL